MKGTGSFSVLATYGVAPGCNAEARTKTVNAATEPSGYFFSRGLDIYELSGLALVALYNSDLLPLLRAQIAFCSVPSKCI